MADDSEQVNQDEIDNLLKESQAAEADAGANPAPAAAGGSGQVDQAQLEALLAGAGPTAPGTASSSGSSITQQDIELLLDKAEQALESVDNSESQTVHPPGIRSFEFQKFGGSVANTDSATLELIGDVQLDMTIELGRTHMQLEELLKLRRGAVVSLDKLAGDPADILVNGRLVARGEVLVLNDNFCIRVAELIEGEPAVA